MMWNAIFKYFTQQMRWSGRQNLDFPLYFQLWLRPTLLFERTIAKFFAKTSNGPVCHPLLPESGALASNYSLTAMDSYITLLHSIGRYRKASRNPFWWASLLCSLRAATRYPVERCVYDTIGLKLYWLDMANDVYSMGRMALTVLFTEHWRRKIDPWIFLHY